MPKTVTFDEIGLRGINTDVAPWSLPPDFVTEGRNFRSFANQIISAGGSTVWSQAPVQFFPGFAYHVDGASSGNWLVAGRDAVYAYNGVTWGDVSSAAGYTNINVDQELDWTACQVGRIPVLNNPQVHPEFWSPQNLAQILQPLPWVAGVSTWSDVGQQCRVIRSHKNTMWALDLIDNGTPFRSSLRFSHPAEENGLPASWDETDDNFLAGRVPLGGDSGIIIDGESLRNSFAVYSENAINIFDEDATFVWRRRELTTTSGLLSKQALVEVKGDHFMLTTQGEIVRNNGNAIQSIMHNRLRRRLSANMNADAYQRSVAVRNNGFGEIWFCVPENASEFPNVAYVYNWRDDSWAIRDIDPIVYASYGPIILPKLVWDDAKGTWDQQRGFWNSREITPFNDTVIGVDRDNYSLLILDPSGERQDYQFLLERLNFALEGHPKVTTITRVYPHCSGTQKLQFQIGSHDYAGSPVRWKPAIEFDPQRDRKIDIRTTGELHAWRFSALGTGTVNLSGITFDYEEAGLR